jgi:putative sigma-54 modulation protein
MRLELTGRKVGITPALRRLVDRKLARLHRVLNDGIISAQVVLTKERYRERVEMTLHARGEKFLHGVGEQAEWEASLAEAVEKISHQASHVKGKWQSRKRRAVPPRALAVRDLESARGEGSPGARIVRAARYSVKPMTVDDAALAVDESPNAFVVFRNAQTDAVNVLYRRRNGDLALIDPDA